MYVDMAGDRYVDMAGDRYVDMGGDVAQLWHV